MSGQFVKNKLPARQILISSGILILFVGLMSCSPAEQARLATAVAQAQTVQAFVATAEAAGTQVAEVRETAEAVVTEISSDPGDIFDDWFGRKVPPDVGVLEDGVDISASPSDVQTAFINAFKVAGGINKIGEPEGRVQRTSGILIQYFSGGSEKYSAIAMSEYGSMAYSITGEWFKTYKGAGGPDEAGYPTSSAESWGPGWWRRGKRQMFITDGEAYAFLQPSNISDVHLVPPVFWKVYSDGDHVNDLGFPLMGFPLDETTWESVDSLSTETQKLLAAWKRSPYRIMSFEKGSIWFDSNYDGSEIISRENIADINLLAGAGRAFKSAWEDSLIYGHDNCTTETLRHGVIAGTNEALKNGFREIAFIPLDATTAVVFGGPGVARFSLRAGYAFLRNLQSNDRAEELGWFIAGEGLDAVFSGFLGDFLAEDLLLAPPLTETSIEIAKQKFEKMKADRFSATIVVQPNVSWLLGAPSTMTAKLMLMYDPLTQVATGLITSDCMPDGILFQYRLDPSTGYPVTEPTKVWDGRTMFWDVASGESLP